MVWTKYLWCSSTLFACFCINLIESFCLFVFGSISFAAGSGLLNFVRLTRSRFTCHCVWPFPFKLARCAREFKTNGQPRDKWVESEQSFCCSLGGPSAEAPGAWLLGRASPFCTRHVLGPVCAPLCAPEAPRRPWTAKTPLRIGGSGAGRL